MVRRGDFGVTRVFLARSWAFFFSACGRLVVAEKLSTCIGGAQRKIWSYVRSPPPPLPRRFLGSLWAFFFMRAAGLLLRKSCPRRWPLVLERGRRGGCSARRLLQGLSGTGTPGTGVGTASVETAERALTTNGKPNSRNPPSFPTFLPGKRTRHGDRCVRVDVVPTSLSRPSSWEPTKD